jgi:hypothetical protein
MITIYALLISAISGIALLALSALSVSIIDLWQYQRPNGELHQWTANAPLIARAGILIPGLLLILSIASLKRELISERVLIHGIAVTSLTLAAIAVFVVVASLMPPIITITGM